ncbi:hypothetical protein JCM30471_27450 [Desulfuromonas carbonis]
MDTMDTMDMVDNFFAGCRFFLGGHTCYALIVRASKEKVMHTRHMRHTRHMGHNFLSVGADL